MRKLPAAFDLLRGWGADYMFTLVWTKGRRGPRPCGYPGYNAEFVVVGSFGRKKVFRETRGFFAANEWFQPRLFEADKLDPRVRGVVNRAAEKPVAFYELIERVTLPPRLAMFARRTIPGFDVWGDECGQLDGAG